MKSLMEKLYFLLVFGELTTALPRIIGGGRHRTDVVHESNPILFFLNVLVVMGTLVYAYPYLPRIVRALLGMKWMFLLYLWMCLSLFWSVDRSASIRPITYSLVYLLSAAYLSFRYPTEELIEKLSLCFLAVALVSVPGEYLLAPVDDPAPGWTGVLLQKNGLGLCMMLGVATLIVRNRRWTPLRCCSLGVYTCILALSQSLTAMVGTALILLFVFSQRVQRRTRIAFLTLGGASLCVATLAVNPVSLFLNAGGKNSSFTGRDVIWAYALNGIVQRPWIGHGYQAFWVTASDVLYFISWNPFHAHNGFLQVLLDLGIVGLILTMSLLINMWRRARRVQRYDLSPAALWPLILIVGAFAHTLMEADLMVVNLMWFLLMLSAFTSFRRELQCVRAKKALTAQQPLLTAPV